jgi:hypothetical protein
MWLPLERDDGHIDAPLVFGDEGPEGRDFGYIKHKPVPKRREGPVNRK